MQKLQDIINSRPKHQRRKILDALVAVYFKQAYDVEINSPKLPLKLEFEDSKEFFQFISDLLKQIL
jgi:hypothetical protein